MSQADNPLLDEFSAWLQNNQVEDGRTQTALIPFLHQKMAAFLSSVLIQQQHIHYGYNFYDDEMANVTLDLQKELTNCLKLLSEIKPTIR